MWYYKEEIITTPRAITIGGLQYNKEVFRDLEKLKELGIKPYRMVMPDARYWHSASLSIDTSGDEVVGTYTAVGREIDDLKSKMLSTVKSQLNERMLKTDWYYLRKLRNGTDVPDDIQEYSDTLYAEYDTKKTEISAMTKMSQIMEYENRPYTEVRKVETYEKNKTIYGPKTTSSTRHINMCMHWTASPNDEVDPSLVSLTAD